MRVVFIKSTPFVSFGETHKLKHDVSITPLSRLGIYTGGFYITHSFPTEKKVLFKSISESVIELFKKAKAVTNEDVPFELDTVCVVDRVGKHTDLLKLISYYQTTKSYIYKFEVDRNLTSWELVVRLTVCRA